MAALKLLPRSVVVASERSWLFGNQWLQAGEQRRLHFIERRGEKAQEIRRLSRVVLVWPAVATVLSILLILLADDVLVVAVVLAIVYGFGAVRRRGLPPKRKVGESQSHLAERWTRRRRYVAIAVTVLLIFSAVSVEGTSPLLLRVGAIAVLFGHLAFRYADWYMDMLVLSSTALWRFQGLLDFRVASLEYSKIQAGPNATSGLAAWLPIGVIEMDSAAQTGDLPMQRIGPVWGAEELAVTIFSKRKSSGQRVRIMNVDDFVRNMNE